MNLKTQITAALTLLFVASALLNADIFPEVAAISPAAREVSTVCGAFFALLVALGAYFRPTLMHERALSFGMLAVLAVSLTALAWGTEHAIPLLLDWGAPLGGMAVVWFSILAGVALTRLRAQDALLAIPTALVISYVVSFVLDRLGTLPVAVASLLYFLAIAGVCLFTLPRIADLMARLRGGYTPEVLDVTNPSSFLPLSSVVYVTVFLFNAASGYGTVQVGGRLPLLGLVLSFLPVVLMMMLAASHWVRVLSPDVLQRASSLLVLAGFLLVPLTVFGPGPAQWTSVASSVLLHGGADCFSVLTYFIVARVGARNPVGALTTSAGVTAAAWIGIAAGAMLSGAMDEAAAGQPDWLMAVTAALTFGFVAYSFVVVKPDSFSRAIDGVLPVVAVADGADAAADPSCAADEEKSAPEGSKGDARVESSGHVDQAEGDKRLDAACARVAERHGLTARELDVLQLLARGRTAPVIQERLVLSHNTVKSHVRHIYSKLDVHSQQQLIDRVDAAAADR